MHKNCTYVVKLLLSHNVQYTRGTYLLSQNISGVYFGVCEKMPATADMIKFIVVVRCGHWRIQGANLYLCIDRFRHNWKAI